MSLPKLGMIMSLVVLATWTTSVLAEALPVGKGVTAADRALAMKLMKMDPQDANPEKDLEIAKVDLNGDGHLDYVVTVNNSMFCGSGGCATGVFVAAGSSYRQVADMLAFGVDLGDGSTKGVRDLVQRGRAGTARWVWEGRTYRQIPAKK